jgi:signal transduction histidine kinase
VPDPTETLEPSDVERNVREIRDRQLASRAVLGAFVYPLVFAMTAFPTGLATREPLLTKITLALLLILALARIGVCLTFESVYPHRPRAWRAGFVLSVASLGIAWGSIAAYSMLTAPWTPTTLLFLFSGSGLAGGMLATIAIDRTAYRLYLLGILVPPGLASVLTEQDYGAVLGGFHLLYFLFLWIQGKRQSASYTAWARNTVEIVIQRDELAAAKKNAEEASKAKSRLLANVSHELRTPLNAIVGTTEWALLQQESGAQKPLWDEIHNAGLHLLTVVNQVLDFSKIDSGTVSQPKCKPFILPNLLQQTEKLFKREATHRGIELRVSTDADEGLALMGDHGRIQQILSNLIGNALKFTTEGWVEARATWEEAHLILEVQDTGPGIATEYLEKVFDPFIQADGSDAREHGGAGLGLSISNELAQSMGGSISLESCVDKGSTFRVILPAPIAANHSKEVGASQGEFVRDYRVLVVDDDPTNLKVARRQLSHLGLRVEEARTGQEALSKCTQEKFDLILMDLQMPQMDGFCITQEIKQNSESPNQTTPIVAFTAHNEDSEKSKCLKAGMVAFLSKPLQRSVLANKLEGLEQRGLL